jgi:GNAT superfamily N-acetyltransferase
MTGTPRVRRAVGTDALAIAELWLGSRRASAAWIPRPTRSDGEVRAWFRDIVVPARETWLVSCGSEPVAVMVLDAEWVEQLYVAPGHLRHGHGTELLDTAKATRGVLELWTFQRNLPARAFYAASGFQRSGTPSSENEEGELASRYRWTR